MKNPGSFYLALAAGFAFLLVSCPAFAEIFQLKTKITEVNASSGYVKVDRLDPQTDKMEEIKVEVGRSVHFDGFQSLSDLKVGDSVSMEVNLNAFSHRWEAQAIGPYHEA